MAASASTAIINPSTFTISAAGGSPTAVSISLPPGVTGPVLDTVTFTAAGTTLAKVPVYLNYKIPAMTIGDPHPASYCQTGGGCTPVTQTINLSGVNGAGMPFAVNVLNNSAYLTVSPTSGTTPLALTLSVNPAGLSAGTYRDSVLVAAPGAANSSITIPVTVTVGSLPAVGVVNGGSEKLGSVSPGEIISIYGTKIGPATPQGLTLTPAGTVSTNLGNVEVFFDGVPAPLLYVSSGQINAQVPYQVGGQSTTNVVVKFNGTAVGETELTVQSQSPGLFITSEQGAGQVAATNENGTVNSSSTPAAEGSVITLYGTGGGQTYPPGVTGSVTPIPTSASGLLKIPGAVTATIGGQPATVEFAGAAPGLVTGVMQVNVQMPSGIGSGTWPVTLSINGVPISNTSATVAVQ